MFNFFRRHRDRQTPDPSTRTDEGQPPTWRALEERDQAQRPDEPGFGGAGYFGSSDGGGQSFNSAQRVYPGDPGYRDHPTRPVTSPRIGAHPTGPKNFQRDDHRIHADVCDRLAMDDAVDVSEVTVDVEQGLVKLEGSVADRYQKYRIEEIAAAVFGVCDVENHIRVGRERGELDISERTLNLS
ncbi:BON domain-containing protein [Cupriavidus pauculus]|uniref:BON domain-containing protein n=1 Tax=Cupriavidus pauculus TaxID=82633 RepID=UPI001FD4302A|nr:BON domain-containing protein [Cupriavidus pauculus]MCM3608113.1 BON domain-containing protein [Cupriavidus pauculus]